MRRGRAQRRRQLRLAARQRTQRQLVNEGGRRAAGERRVDRGVVVRRRHCRQWRAIIRTGRPARV
jgi:hypothetical protein